MRSPCITSTEHASCRITFVVKPVDEFSALQGIKSTDTLLFLAVLYLPLFLSQTCECPIHWRFERCVWSWEYVPCDKHQEVSLHESKIDISYYQLLDKAEYNMHDELRRSTRVLSAKADNFLCRAFHNLKLDLVSLRKQSWKCRYDWEPFTKT